MRVRVVTIPFDVERGRFDDDELARFQDDREVLAVSDHLVHVGGLPHLALLVSWRPAAAARERHPPPPRDRPPGPVVSAEHEAAFHALKRWRNDRARRDGRPPYVLFTNQQLAAIAAGRPGTAGALAEVPGVGVARIRDYADEMLAVLAGAVDGG